MIGLLRSAAAHPVLRRFAGLATGRALGQAFHAVALVLVARWAGPAEFGSFSGAFGVLVGVSGIVSLGLPQFTLRSAVLGRVQAVGYAFFLNMATSLLVFVAGLFTVLLFPGIAWWSVLLLAASVGIEKNVDVRIGLGTEFGQARLVNGAIALRGLGIMLVVATAPVWSFSAVSVYVVARLVAMATSGLVIVRGVRNAAWKITWRRPQDGSLESLGSFAVTASAGSLRMFDTAIVGAVGGGVLAGLYAATQKVNQPLLLLSASLGVVVIGPVTRRGPAGLRRVARGSALLAGGLLVLCAPVAVFSAPLVVLVFGEAFRPGAGALAWIALGLGAIVATSPLGSALQALGAARATAVNTVVFSVLMLALLPVGTIWWGATGAAAVTTLATWARVAGLLFIARRCCAVADAAVCNQGPEFERQGRGLS